MPSSRISIHRVSIIYSMLRDESLSSSLYHHIYNLSSSIITQSIFGFKYLGFRLLLREILLSPRPPCILRSGCELAAVIYN